MLVPIVQNQTIRKRNTLKSLRKQVAFR